MTWLQRIVAAVNRPSRDTRLILERIAIMNENVAGLRTAFAGYAAKVDAYITAAEQHKTDVAKLVADAVQKDNAEEEVDLQHLKAEIEAAAAKVPPAPQPPVEFKPSNN